MKKISIIGGSGFVGTNLCQLLASKQNPFEIIDLKPSKQFPDKCKIGDVRDIDTLRKTNDGFVIAEKDLEIRGAGEVLGTRQTGSVSFRVADIMRDQHWLPEIEPLATSLQQYAPENVDLLIDRWIGQREDYVNA